MEWEYVCVRMISSARVICWKDGSFSFAEAAHTQVLRCVSMEITNLNETVKRMCF